MVMENKARLTELLKETYPKNVYIDIFRILIDEKYVTNSNGVFFDLDKVSDKKIQDCIYYLNSIQTNIEDHFQQLNIRESIEDDFKKKINSKTVKKQEKKVEKKQKVDKPIKDPFAKKVYKGVYSRLDRVIRGVKKEEKNTRKIKKEETQEEEEDLKEFEEGCESEEEIVEDVDIFGEDSDEESDNIID